MDSVNGPQEQPKEEDNRSSEEIAADIFTRIKGR